MGLEPQFSVSDFIASVIVYDCTGKYNKVNNPGGLGGANVGVSDIISVKLEVFVHASGKTFTKELYPSFPAEDKSGFELLPSFFGSADGRIQSGKYSFKLTYSGITMRPIVVSADYVFNKTARYDVNQLRLNTLNEPIDSQKSKKSEELSRLMDKVEWATECGAGNSAQQILGYVVRQVRICC